MNYDNSAIRLVPGSDETELYVSWHSEKGKKATLLFAESNDLSNAVEYTPEVIPAEDDAYQINRVVVKSIAADTQYYYATTKDSEVSSETYAYHSRNPKKYSILFSTDVQLGAHDDFEKQISLWNRTINTAIEKSPELNFIVHSGDQTTTGRVFKEWWGYYSPSALRSVPIFSVLGNHDRKGDTINYYTFYPNQYDMRFPSRPNLSDISVQPVFGRDSWFRYGDVLYVHFDSTCGSAGDHYKCAKEAVEKNPDVKWIVGAMHHDLYGSTSSAGMFESTFLFRHIYTPIFDKFGFDVILTGHSHCYGRSHQIYNRQIVEETKGAREVTDPVGTVYISGCCGGDLYDESIPRIPQYEWTAYRYEKFDNVSTVISFDDTGDKCVMNVDTYECATGEKVDSYQITKTVRKRFGGSAVKDAVSKLQFVGIRAASAVYMAVDTVYRFYQGKAAKKKNYTPHN